MANYSTPVKIDELAAANSVVANSRLLILQANTTANTVELKLANVTTFFSNVSSVKVANLVLSTNSTPANSTITVPQGTMWYDTNYLYIAVANNTLKRVALTSF
jgi:hypothetical protein